MVFVVLLVKNHPEISIISFLQLFVEPRLFIFIILRLLFLRIGNGFLKILAYHNKIIDPCLIAAYLFGPTLSFPLFNQMDPKLAVSYPIFLGATRGHFCGY